MSTTTSTSNSPEKPSIARNMWLAGIGLYATAFEQARDKVSGIRKTRQLFVKDLVNRGQSIEEATQDQVVRYKQEARGELDARIAAVRNTLVESVLSTGKTTGIETLQKENTALKRKVKRLSTKVEKLESTQAVKV